MPYTGRDHTPFAVNSETSFEAAIRAQKFVSQQGMEVYAWLKAQGTHGGTRKELEAATGIKTQSLCARLKALQDAGAIQATDQRRSGCQVYVVVCGRVPRQLGMSF